ncbi:hypothetical protein E2C01_045182 [Portunus trituberculatus]|uniref:Uncharacterized protein n=1 Tax=Portunus trituberculatus TaxID=210409 RepID=A0A5B7G1D6_PORTR|nr:hypothetical protein [Portunus trituberculatus]
MAERKRGRGRALREEGSEAKGRGGGGGGGIGEEGGLRLKELAAADINRRTYGIVHTPMRPDKQWATLTRRTWPAPPAGPRRRAGSHITRDILQPLVTCGRDRRRATSGTLPAVRGQSAAPGDHSGHPAAPQDDSGADRRRGRDTEAH